MTETLPAIRYTGLSAYVEAYAKDDNTFPVISLFGAKNAVQAIAAALVSRKEKIFLMEGTRPQEVWLTSGEYRIFGKNLPCGAHHALVINTQALLRHASLPSFLIVSRSGEEKQVRSIYFSFLDRLLPLPLLPGWASWLWERGMEKEEIHPLQGYRLTAHECHVDPEALKKDLSQAIKKKILFLRRECDETGSESQGGILPDAAINR